MRYVECKKTRAQSASEKIFTGRTKAVPGKEAIPKGVRGAAMQKDAQPEKTTGCCGSERKKEQQPKQLGQDSQKRMDAARRCWGGGKRKTLEDAVRKTDGKK